MKIANDRKIKDIQDEFSEKFPGLKIHFYSGRHEGGSAIPPDLQISPDKTVAQAGGNGHEGEISLDGHLKVATLEDVFWREFGLNVQVFRLSGNLWLQTSTTDQWTLAEQNRKGEHSAESYRDMHGEED